MGAAGVEVAARDSLLAGVLRRGRLRAAVALFGPGFVASVAYVDPGNFATNFAAGARDGYLLVWVVVAANIVAILVQYLTSKAGLVTGKNLPELCSELFPRRVNLLLWLQAEVVAMATDLAEFVGAALGLHLVFHLGLFPAGLVTAAVACGILSLERRGYRRFELAVIALLGLVAVGFIAEFFTAGHESAGAIAGGFVPRLGDAGSLTLAVGIVGATVMPHVVYLHSALQAGRIRPADRAERALLLAYNAWDCIIGLGVAGLVNLAMLCIAAALFHHRGLEHIAGLAAVHGHLVHLVGGGAALVFAIALMASGLSSASVGTYAGQVVMGGFIGARVPLLARRVVTMLPALGVLAFATNTSAVLIASQVVLAFGIPFALVPLVVVGRRRALFGEVANGRLTNGAILLVTLAISGLDAYLVVRVLASL